MMSKLKMSSLVFLVMLVGLSTPMVFGEQNRVTNGDFDTDISDWTLIKDASTVITDPTMYLAAAWDGTEGYTAVGCARLNRLPCSVATGSYRFYTVWPVTAGKLYQVEAMVKGDLKSVANGSRTWFEMSVCFIDGLPPSTPEDITETDNWSSDYYEVRYGSDPGDLINTTTGIFDWTPITELPGEGDIAPEEGFLVPAGMTHMLVGFNLGARDTDPISSVGEIFVYIDDVVVTSCQGNPVGDLDGDCKVTLGDFAMLAESWMECELDPVSSCDL